MRLNHGNPQQREQQCKPTAAALLALLLINEIKNQGKPHLSCRQLMTCCSSVLNSGPAPLPPSEKLMSANSLASQAALARRWPDWLPNAGSTCADSSASSWLR